MTIQDIGYREGNGYWASMLPTNDPASTGNTAMLNKLTMSAVGAAILVTVGSEPRRRAAECGDEFAPSKANPHLALPCEPVDQAGGCWSTGDRRSGADRPPLRVASSIMRASAMPMHA
jgi:hypothetical protein